MNRLYKKPQSKSFPTMYRRAINIATSLLLLQKLFNSKCENLPEE